MGDVLGSAAIVAQIRALGPAPGILFLGKSYRCSTGDSETKVQGQTIAQDVARWSWFETLIV